MSATDNGQLTTDSSGTRSARLAFDRGDFAGLLQTLEPEQVVLNLLLGLLAEQLGEPLPNHAGRRDVIEHHFHLGAAVSAGRIDEADRSGVVHVRAAERPPGDRSV